MTSDAPEFYTKPSTPISPIPHYPPTPSKFPVLQNQIDQVFNMTSTHIESAAGLPSTLNLSDNHKDFAINANPDAADADADRETSDENSFSDPFEEPDEPKTNGTVATTIQASGGEVDDDYAMTFESDGEMGSNSQDVPNENMDQDTTTQSTPPPLSGSETVPSLNAADPPINATSENKNIDDLSHNPTISHPTAPPADAPPVAADPESAPAPAPAPAMTEQSQAPSQPPMYESIAKGEIDIQQLLDNITANAELNASAAPTPTTAVAAVGSPKFPPGPSALSSHSSLPPRPQVLQKPSMHPAYASQDDIRKYHAGPSYAGPPGTSYRAPGMPPMSIVAAGAPGTHTDPRNVLPPPPPASFNAPPPSLSAPPPGNLAPYPPHQRVPTQERPIEGEGEDEGEVQWGPDVQKLYDDFLADERMYVSEGLWDRFPTGSRLFIGNLPTEKVTKRDLFYVFHKYGRLAQVSIKQAYGFVQFHDVAACYAALDREQGQEIRGRKMHLEISKPQKNTRQATAAQNQALAQRRSRSPDYARGGARQSRAQPQAYDRYDTRPLPSPRDDYRTAPQRARDDYRPLRSPTPPRPYRARDDYTSRGGRDHYPTERRRSRSPPRYRTRSPSPRRDDALLSLPRRSAADVPDVQILLLDELDRGFITWVESELRARGLTTEVMFLSPRLPVDAVVRRQIVEGVTAVAKLTRGCQTRSTIPLQVFDRSRGVDNVRFDEYADLEPRVAAELVVREKAKQAAAAGPTYPQQQYQQYQQPAPAAPQAAAPNLANLVGQLDNATLQKLLGTLNAPAQPQQQNPAAAQANAQIDLAGILGGLMGKPQGYQQAQGPAQGPQQNQYAAPQQATQNLGALLGAQGGQGGQGAAGIQAGPQSAAQVQNIMAQLARFRQ